MNLYLIAITLLIRTVFLNLSTQVPVNYLIYSEGPLTCVSLRLGKILGYLFMLEEYHASSILVKFRLRSTKKLNRFLYYVFIW